VHQKLKRNFNHIASIWHLVTQVLGLPLLAFVKAHEVNPGDAAGPRGTNRTGRRKGTRFDGFAWKFVSW
jgi:hypothetical protein